MLPNGSPPNEPSNSLTPEELDELLIEIRAACQAGEYYAEAGDQEKAAAVYQHALLLAEQCGQHRMSAIAGMYLGKALVELGLLPEALPVLETARVRYETNKPHPIPRGQADCDQATGRAFQQLGQLSDAIAAYRRALLLYTDPALGLDDERNSCALNLASALAATGAFSQALEILDDAERRCTRRSDAIEIAINTGVICAESGRYDTAHEKLERSRATAVEENRNDLVALCDTNLGYVHLHAGRLGHAEAAYARAKDYYEHRDQSRFATSWMNLGTVRGCHGDHAQAIEAYNEGLAVFKVLELPERIAACRMNLGVEHAALGDLSTAQEFYHRAQKHYETSPTHARQAAGCAVNLARLDDSRGHHLQAQQAYREAADRFHALGLYEWEARCTIYLAESMSATPRHAGGPDPAAVDLLLPALLYLDSVKFQFPTAAARLAWRHTVSDATRLAFELAMDSGDAELVAALIETTINSGIYTTTHDSAVDLREDEKLLRLNRSEWTVNNHHSLGPVRLIAGARLPMAAPPRIRMPTGAIALERFHIAADHYRENPPVARPDPPAVGGEPGNRTSRL